MLSIAGPQRNIQLVSLLSLKQLRWPGASPTSLLGSELPPSRPWIHGAPRLSTYGEQKGAQDEVGRGGEYSQGRNIESGKSEEKERASEGKKKEKLGKEERRRGRKRKSKDSKKSSGAGPGDRMTTS